MTSPGTGNSAVRFSTAESYCNRLAAILSNGSALEWFRAALTELEWQQLFDQASTPPQCTVYERLLNSPRLQAIAASATNYTPSVWLLEQELLAQNKMTNICQKSNPWCGHIATNPTQTCKAGAEAVYAIAREVNAAGLCFSGGGIRSATFNLGILQALGRLNLLNRFSYLSSVSGGGYIHMFLAAWLRNLELFPPKNIKKPTDQKRAHLEFVEEQMDPLPQVREPPLTEQPEPIRWLRRYSNYLTPRTGLFSTDTWVVVAVWLRNTFLNQIVLISFIATILCVPHFLLLNDRVYSAFRAAYAWSVLHVPVVPVLLIAALGVCGIIQLTKLLPKGVTDQRGEGSAPKASGASSVQRNTVRWWKLVALELLAISVLASPAVYRVSFVTPTPTDAAREYTRPDPCGHDCFPAVGSKNGPSKSSATILSSLALNPHPWCTYVPPVHRRRQTLSNWFANHRYPFWTFRTPLFSVEAALLAVTLLLCFCGGRYSSEDLERRPVWKAGGFWYAIVSALVSTGAMFGLLHLIRMSFFASAFLLPPALFRAWGIVVMPLLVLSAIFLALVLTAGIMGNLTDDARREDLARLRALGFSLSLLWLASSGFSLLGPEIVHQIAKVTYLRPVLTLGWFGTTISSVLAGKSTKSSSNAHDSGLLLKLLIKVGPPVFVLGLLLLVSTALNVTLVRFCSQWSLLWTFLGLLAITALFGLRLDINDFSMHAFYRDRIARCFAGASHPHRRPDRFTGFAESDGEIHVHDLLPQRFRHSAASVPVPKFNYEGPFPIFCTSVNLTFGQDLAWQERKAASFAFTPLYSGYSVGFTADYELTKKKNKYTYNGFERTCNYAYPPQGIPLHSAVAISGAAISPNWGYHTDPAMAFLLTVFNVRLGWWIRNPRLTRDPLCSFSASPRFPLFPLLQELMGRATDTAEFVYLTDGGHFDNMGLYELVRRRCRRIVICDAEEDGGNTFEGIGMAIRKARVDFGVEINLDLRRLDPRILDPAQVPPSPVAPFHFVKGTIRYPEDGENAKPGDVVYIKAGITGDEPGDVLNYKRQHTDFPHESTLDQWFTESQFESYRRLGYHSILGVTKRSKWLGLRSRSSVEKLLIHLLDDSKGH